MIPANRFRTARRRNTLLTPPAFDAAGVGATTGGATMTWNHTCSGNNRALLVATAIYRSGSGGSAPGGTRGCTYAGVALTSLGVQSYLDGTGWIELWGLLNPATGTNQVAWYIDTNPTLKDWDGGSVSYTGVGSLGTVASNRGSSAAPTLSVNSSTGARVAAFFQSRSNLSAPTQTQRYLDNSSPRIMIQDAVGANPVTFGATVSSNSWETIGVEMIGK